MTPRKKRKEEPVTVTYLDAYPLKDVHPDVYNRAMELAGGNVRRLRAQSYTEIVIVNHER